MILKGDELAGCETFIVRIRTRSGSDSISRLMLSTGIEQEKIIDREAEYDRNDAWQGC